MRGDNPGDRKAARDHLEGSVDAVVSEEEALTAQRATRDQVSKLMGQRMLQGWTLLAESCGRCFHPFMSLRGGPMVCLQCEVEGVATPAAQPGESMDRDQESRAAISHQAVRPSQAGPGRNMSME